MAGIPCTEIGLGGIKIGDNINKVYSIYGPPKSKEYEHDVALDHITYGNGLDIHSLRGGSTGMFAWMNYTVFSIRVTENNGWKTPAGIGVGMDEQAIYSAYGTPDERISYDDNSYFRLQYWSYYLPADPSRKIGMGCYISFTIDKKSRKIQSIYARG